MGKFLKTYVGKGLLYFAVILSSALFVLSVISAAFMIYEEYYIKTEDDIRTSTLGTLSERTSVEVFEREYDFYNGGFRNTNTSDYGHFVFRITDIDGNVMTKSTTTPESYGFKVYITYLDPHQSGYAEHGGVTSISRDIGMYKELKQNNPYTKLYIVESDLNFDNDYIDMFSIYVNVHHTLYSLKTGIYFIALLAFVTMIAAFASLMCVAGRRPGKEEIVPWVFHKIPFDVVTAVYFAFVMTLYYVMYQWIDEIGVIIALALCCLFFPLYCMSIAVRIKTHTLIKNTVIYKILAFMWKCLKAAGRFIVTVFTNMKLLYKVIIAMIIFMVIAAVSVVDQRIGAMLWCLLPFTVFPLLVYITLQINKIKKGARELAGGNFDHVVETGGMFPEIKKHADNLNSIAAAQKIAVEEKLKSERMKTELITNVSHDIKTPLTSIINYADLISKEENTSKESKEYCEVLVRQSVRLKRLLEDLVEASKASTGNLEVDLQPCDAQVFITQSAGEFEEKFKEHNLTLLTNVPDTSIRIMADGRRMQRIFDNLMNNACKYSLPGTRVYVDLKETDKDAVFEFKNTSKEALNMSEEELMERFTRGDSSRNTEGSGLGLSIAGTLAELQNGQLRLNTDGDLFKATLSFPKI